MNNNNNIDLGRDITHDLQKPLYPGIGGSVIELPITYLGYDSTGITAEKFIGLVRTIGIGVIDDNLPPPTYTFLCSEQHVRSFRLYFLGYNLKIFRYKNVTNKQKQNIINTFKSIYKTKTNGRKKFNIRRVQSWN